MKKFLALVVMLCAVMISSTAVAATNWVWIYSDEYLTVWVDNNSIRRDYNYQGYVFRAFTKFVYSAAGRNRVIENERSSGRFVSRGMYNLSHSIDLFYFKAGDSMNYFDVINAVGYTHDGNIIPDMGVSKDSIYWTIIQPDTVGEEIFNKVRARIPN